MLQACPVCDSVLITPVRDSEDLWKCPSCLHIFQNPPTVTARYGLEYVHDRYDQYPTTAAMSHLRVGLLRAFAGPGAAVLDVGYGNGDFIKTAIKAGYDAWGHDVIANGKQYGIRDCDPEERLHWDVITFFDSLEHFPGLAEPKRWLKHTDYAVVSFPARPNDFPENLNWRHYRPGEHLHYFSAFSLAKLMPHLSAKWAGNVEDTVRSPATLDQQVKSHNIMTIVYRRFD
jgi:hypothetical protein